jgi:hypothetical protein
MTQGTTPSDPQALREEIAQTRADLGETVEALAAKTDVSARAKDAVGEAAEKAKDAVTTVASQAKDTVAKTAGQVKDQVVEKAAQVKEQAVELTEQAKQGNPVPLAILAAAVAAVISVLVWAARRIRR